MRERAPAGLSPSPDPRNLAASYPSHRSILLHHPRPVFALSHCLLAYALPASSHSYPHSYAHTHASTGSPSTSPLIPHAPPSGGGGRPLGLGLPTTQAELGHTALKVGGSVLSGMRTLGGMALSTAKSQVASSSSGPTSRHGHEEAGGGVMHFFWCSAPSEGAIGAAGEREEDSRRERRYSSTSSGMSVLSGPTVTTGVMHLLTAIQIPEGGCWVTVVDLALLWSRRKAGLREPEKLAEFLVSKDKHVAGLRLSSDRCFVVPHDGEVGQMFQLQLGPAVGKMSADADGEKKNAVECASDGRWVAIAARKRTVDVFPVNPDGAKPDHRSHLEGRVRNINELQPMPMEVSPIVRLHVQRHPVPLQVPLAFMFPPVNFQDILLFDPMDRMLSLWRCSLELRPRDRGTIGIAALSGTSILLPGMGCPGKLSVSPSKSGAGRSGSGKSRLTEMMDVQWRWLDMWGEESEVRKPLQNREGSRDRVKEKTSEAITTVHLFVAPVLIPYSYHALIQRYQLDISGHKIDVCKEVQISPYPAGSGESFVEGFSSPCDICNRTFSSLFDEPLTSALAGGLNYHHSSGILPMLPTDNPHDNWPWRWYSHGKSTEFGHPDFNLIRIVYSSSGSKMDDEPDIWNRWSAEDKAAVEEAEQFDVISVVGFLDEEQEQESRRMPGPKHTSVLAEKPNIKRKGRGRWREI
ncbi:hypothetical protein L208DRAFT_1537069 [Tricholoma matsutake]|nr:hypothetical protein L208DRAFT_1537069 [Tricholoma matsutake 945]